MYNRQWRAWQSAEYDEARLLWCRESFNRENPEALFTLADAALGKAGKGKETAEAVYNMEKAAKLGHAQAALAMGELFQYGWAVHRSQRMSLEWYEKAAALGSAEAASRLAELRRARRRRAITWACAALAVVLAACALVLFLPERPPEGILVHEDTQLTETATFEEFNSALSELIRSYDDELVVSGQRSTNRLLLKFEGPGIDLSDFPAAEIIADSDNYLVVQFESEEEAQRCLDALTAMDGILFVDTDEYAYTAGSAAQRSVSAVPYTSPYSGEVYYSWGVEYLGLDRLAAWLKDRNTSPVTVAVLDTGVEPCDENAHCILEGMDVTNPGSNGWTDDAGHGTHVAGTIIDCTWGLDVSILPVRVFVGETTSDSYVAAGLKYAIESGADVINMSLGGSCVCGADGSCGSPIDYYVTEAWNSGIVVVVAAGNGDENGVPEDTAVCCPAHMTDCIVVSARASTGKLGSFSNYGDTVDVCAPGVEVLSYYPGDVLAALDGTSMAAPHISALAAMLKLYLPDKTPEQIEKYIGDYCTDMGDPAGYGEGIPWAGYFAGD